jgi:adenylyl-sulfate kinase
MYRPVCLWITGLPAAGKSTLADALEGALKRSRVASCILDGDALRLGINSNLGFSADDRAESTRRAGEVARLMVGAGLVAIVSLISPFRRDRDAVRERFAPGDFIEIFLDTPAEICEARDPKGHYRKARAGVIREFTGVSSPYEPPLEPEIALSSVNVAPEDLAAVVLARIKRREASTG